MKHSPIYMIVALIAGAGLLLASCAPAATPTAAPTQTSAPQTAAATATTSTSSGTGNMTFALVPKNLGNPYFDTSNQGAQKAATELGVKVLYQGPSTADATAQIQVLDSLIAQKVSGLAISADDANALVPVGKTAMGDGIPVVSFDSAIAPDGRVLNVLQATTQGIGEIEIQMAEDLAGSAGGKIAILSATSSAPNQNAWIAVMKTTLQESKYSNLQLVDTVYGNDDDTLSYTQAQGLIQKYPDLKVIIAPTTVGIAAAARAVTDAKLIGKVFVTGLGDPNQMKEYVSNGASPEFALWNPSDLGYLAIYTLYALATKEITGKVGDTFTAGTLGKFTVQNDSTNGNYVLLGKPTIFNKDNIGNFNF